VVLGSRILGAGDQRRHAALQVLQQSYFDLDSESAAGAKLSEYHTGYRAFARQVLESIPWEQNSNDFVFDNQMLSQIIYQGYTVGEISCPAKYFPEASSINFTRSVKYGLGCLLTAIQFRLSKMSLISPAIFCATPKRLKHEKEIHVIAGDSFRQDC
jgi:hypothetical protein